MKPEKEGHDKSTPTIKNCVLYGEFFLGVKGVDNINALNHVHWFLHFFKKEPWNFLKTILKWAEDKEIIMINKQRDTENIEE